jgi:hypothetical protein
MKRAPALLLLGTALLVGAPLVAGCTGAAVGVAPSASVDTAIQGWGQWFRLDWQAVPRPDGGEIGGYIYNDYGAAAANVQILAQGVDAAGNVVGQKIVWVSGTVPALDRSYFKVSGLPAAPQYRVSVWAFDFVQSPDGNRL